MAAPHPSPLPTEGWGEGNDEREDINGVRLRHRRWRIGRLRAGRAGSATNPATRVCLIEAGPPDNNFLCHMPFATALFIPGKWRNWAFETEPQPGLDGRRGYQPRGRMLGGSSGLNAMIYIRGHASDYDDWAAQGATRLVVRRRAALLQARRGQRAPHRRAARQRAARSTLPTRSAPTRSTRCSWRPATSCSCRATTISTAHRRRASASIR